MKNPCHRSSITKKRWNPVVYRALSRPSGSWNSTSVALMWFSKISWTRGWSFCVSSKHTDKVSLISFTKTDRYPRRKYSTEVGSHSQRCKMVG